MVLCNGHFCVLIPHCHHQSLLLSYCSSSCYSSPGAPTPTVSTCSEMDGTAMLSSTKSSSISSTKSLGWSPMRTQTLFQLVYTNTPLQRICLCRIQLVYGGIGVPKKESLNWLTWYNSDDTSNNSSVKSTLEAS